MARRRILLPVVLLSLACADGGDPRVQVQTDTLGDTIVVRTLAGSVWGAPAVLEPELRIGEFDGADPYMFGDVASLAVGPDGSIYAMDRQVPALRKYRPDGTFVATFGREGAGPGEYRRPDGGLVTLADGRVVLRDPANARLQVYAPTGEPLATVPIRGNLNTSNNMVVDTAGRVYTIILLDPEADVTQWRSGLVGYDIDSGAPVDTVPTPTWEFEEPRLVARRVTEDGTSTSINGVPFSPAEEWAFSPLGYMIGGVSSRYAIDQYHRDGGVVRIERAAEPVPVEPGEKENAEARARWNMRRTQPDWTWNGPAIPDHKPFFDGLWVGRDGRIWVRVPRPGQRIADDEIDPPAAGDPDPRPAQRWREPVAFDVFEADGTYLGAVHAPRGFSLYPTPVFDGDRVWAIVRDELDVQYLTRFRVAPATGGESTQRTEP